MGVFVNGNYFPTIEDGASKPFGERCEFRTREEQVQLFFRYEFEDFCEEEKVKNGALLNIATQIHGVRATVDAKGMAKYCAKPSPHSATQRPRIYTSENYLLRYNVDEQCYEAIKLLGNDEWLQVERVRKAFLRICKGKDWLPWTISEIQLSDIRMKDGFSAVALTAEVHAPMAIKHTMTCLLANGLLMLDADAEVTPWCGKGNVVRTADCVFRIERNEKGISSFSRL